jgi:arabinofuranosyltransferase
MNAAKPLVRGDRVVLGVLVVLLLLVLVLITRDVFSFGVDDSYIFFRYAENVGDGAGFVFNRGEAAGEGFTSWVWLLLLAFCHILGVNLPLAAKILGVGFHLLGGLLIFLIARRIAGKNRISTLSAGLLAAAFLLNYRLIAHSVSGMETSLYILALVGMVYLTTVALQLPVDQDRWWWILSLGTLGLFFIRPEGMAAGGISLLALGIHQRRRLLRPIVWFYVFAGLIVPLALFLILKLVIFGYPLPHSFYHKLIVIEKEYAEAFRQCCIFLLTYWWLVILAVVTAAYSLIKHKKYLFLYYGVIFFFMVGIYLFFYPTMNYLHRFYIPYLPLLLLMIVPVTYCLVEKASSIRYFPWRCLSWFLLVGMVVVGMNLNLGISKKKVKSWSLLVNPKVYRAKLGELMSHLPAEVKVANTEMGVIPYYSRLTCIDMAGLTDPHIAHHGLSMDYLDRRQVDLILFSRDVAALSLAQWDQYTWNYKDIFLSQRFKGDFELIGAFKAWPGSGKKYYLYGDKTSPRFPILLQWRQKFSRWFQ